MTLNAHVCELLDLALTGNEQAIRSLACMALLVGGGEPPSGGGERVPMGDNVIAFQPKRRAA